MGNKKVNGLFVLVIVFSLLMSACGNTAAVEPTASVSAPEPAAAATEAATELPTANLVPTEVPLSGSIRVSGAFALYPMMTVWADEFTKLHPDVQFDVQGGGAGKGMTDTIAGAVDIGMISRSIKEEESSQGIFWVSVTKDAAFPLINEKNPVAADILAKGISQETFNKIFITGEYKTWGDVVGRPEVTDAINVYTRTDSSGAAEMWAKFSGGKAQDEIVGIGVNGEPALVNTVLTDPLGIGYANLNSTFDLSTGKVIAGIVVPPIDVNKNGVADEGENLNQKDAAVTAIADGLYPSPPARFENLATKGKPTGLTLEFIKWILTDGQQYLDSAGYVPLTAEQQAESLGKLK